ncbi:MAG: asparagine synthase (glutamine-hydrolyzing), partial [Fibrobacterota bacterium]|nr:asparagine synthase (glutamine-hydrolyzing) [Fibrobacterota bacterium]
MCGIAGVLVPAGGGVDPNGIRVMTRALEHRGPDEEGYHVEGRIGLGQRRLSIIDLAGGHQPIYNEDGTVCVVFNGEIFNYLELRRELEGKGHRFRTRTDTETIVHAYEEYGRDFPSRLNGQFAIALWDARSERLVLARDRMGIRPLFYAEPRPGEIIFASEMKSLFHHPGLRAEIDPQGLNQIFTFWVNVPPRTPFKGVKELRPGECMWISPERTESFLYWKPSFPDAGDYPERPLSHYVEGLREIMHHSLTLQLRSDVPVAAYLSGGLDSSIISSLVKRHHNPDLQTFSLAFAESDYDERAWQMQAAQYIGTRHRTVEVDNRAVAETFPRAVWFAERPLLRAAPAPMFTLAGLVRSAGIKVVLTGEGADEIFAGYNIFREDKVRRFWARQPESRLRPRLLSALYPYINKSSVSQAFWRSFFKRGLTDTGHRYYSHLIRWQNTSFIKDFLQPELRAQMDDKALYEELDAYTDPDMMRWDPLCRAQYLEMALFMPGYLLNSQGDRMMMGNSVEGRFPFLDHRVVEFAATIPPKYKLRLLEEKYI